MILTPRGEALFTIAPDGSIDAGGRDLIVCNGHTVNTVEAFLVRTRGRSALADRAFLHLNTCSSLDWLTTRNLEVNLRSLETVPSADAVNRLQLKLADCPITTENRAVLDRLADRRHFTWSERGARWLAYAYARFGDLRRVRELAAEARLSREDVARLVEGPPLLTAGKVQGRMTVRGRPTAGIRLGLVRLDRWRELAQPGVPDAWAAVCAATYTDKAGAFQFSPVPDGRYLLVLTGGEIGRIGGRPVILNSPGAIDLDSSHPTRVLQPFDIEFMRTPRGPGEGPPRTTV